MDNRSMLRLLVLGGCGLALMGCQSVRDAAGLGKSSPDEFAVATKAPLIIPPDYNLRPPRDGAPPTNLVEPTESAQTALFGDDPNAKAKLVTGNYSDGEKLLLAYANAVNPDPSIRQQIAADGRAMESSNDSFTDQVLFWQGKPAEGANVDADAEAKRIADQKAAGHAGAARPAKDSATIRKDDSDESTDRDSGHGWFGWIF